LGGTNIFHVHPTAQTRDETDNGSSTRACSSGWTARRISRGWRISS